MLLGPNNTLSALASGADRSPVQACADLHSSYLKHCLPPVLSTAQAARLHSQAGIIIFDPNPLDPEADPEIICSGWSSDRPALTARHCLGKLTASGNPKPVLRFLPIAARAALTNKSSPARSGVELTSVLSPQAFSSAVSHGSPPIKPVRSRTIWSS
jgi:hypothetical protein